MKSQGLGDTVAKITSAVGIKPCGGCGQRKKWLNKHFPYRSNGTRNQYFPVQGNVKETSVMDIVYPLASGRHGRKRLGSRWDNNELRYSLRSMEKHFPNLGQIFIVTEELPEWLTNVVGIYAKDTHKRNKDANLIDKVLLACKSGVSETFIRMSDDQCLLDNWDGSGVWHMGERADWKSAQRKNKWWKRYGRTCEYLKSKGHPTYFYDCHCPIQVNRERFVEVMQEVDYQTPPGMCINTLYCNSVKMRRIAMSCQKVAVHRRVGPRELRGMTDHRLFLGYNELATNKWLKAFLEKRYPEKSRFEK